MRGRPWFDAPPAPRARLSATYRTPRRSPRTSALAVSADRYAIAEFQAFSQRELDMFASTVADVPEPYRDDIVAVLSSVLSESLRGYVVGFYPMSGVYQRLDTGHPSLMVRSRTLAWDAPAAVPERVTFDNV
jgi:hypothetical protein